MLRKVLIGAFLACAIAVVTLFATGAPVGAWLVQMVEWIGSLGVRGGILFALIYVVVTVVLFPQTPLNLIAGFLYGTLWGSVVVSVASTLAAMIAFLLTRYVARDVIARKLGRYARFENLDRVIEKHGLKLVFLMRLQPVFVPFAYLNMGLGLTRVSLFDYIAGTLLGTLPGTVLYAYAGRAVKDISFLAFHIFPTEGSGPRWFLWVGFAAVLALSILLAQMARQSYASALKEQSEAEGKLHIRTTIKVIGENGDSQIVTGDMENSSANI